MANAFSQLHNYDGELWTPNMQLIQQALQFKETSLSAGRQKLSEMRRAVKGLDVIKEQDQEYIDNRFKTAIDIVDQYSNLDLSDANLVKQLTGKLGEIVDPTAMNAIMSTQKLRAEQQDWEKHKDDEDFSEINRRYAMQNAEKWLNDGKVGSQYQGGGGFIPYADFQKKLMTNLPNISKMLEADWVEIGNGQGYFKSKIKGKEIKREDLRNALGTLFDERDYQQMSINAWDAYDKAPEEAIQDRFESKRNSDLEATKYALEQTEVQLGKPLSEENKNKLLAHKELLEQNIQTLEKNTYSNTVSKVGIKNIYSSMYREDFIGGVLDAYAKRTITDIGIDDISKENAYYDLKLQENRRANEEHLLDMETGKLDYAKKALELGKLQEDQTLRESGVVEGADRAVNYSEGTSKDYVEKAYQKRDESREGLKSLFIDNNLASNEEEANEILSSPEFKKQMQNLSSLESITVNGKSIKVKDNIALLHNFKNSVMGIPKEIKEIAFPTIDKTVEAIQKQLIAGSRLGADMDINTLPWMGFQLKEDAGGNLVYEGTSGVNNYPKLLKQKGYNQEFKGKPGSIGNTTIKNTDFSKAQDKTLKLYTLFHLSQDPSLSGANKKVVQDRLDDLMAELPQKTRERVNTYFKQGLQGKQAFRDFNVSDFTTGDLEISGGTGAGSSTAGDLNVINSYRSEILKSKGLDKLIKDNMSSINNQLNNIYSAKNELLKEAKDYKVRVGSKEHQAVMDLINMTDPKFDKEFILRSQTNNFGEFTGKIEIIWQTPIPGKSGAFQPESKLVEPSKLIERGLPEFNFAPEKNPYNARAGKYAETLDLGNNIYSEEKQEMWDPKIYNGYTGGLSEEEQTQFIEETREFKGDAHASITENLIKDYKEGKFTFKLEPSQSNGMYYIKVYDQEKKLFYRQITPYSQITDQELKKIQEDPRNLTDQVFKNALIDYKPKQ